MTIHIMMCIKIIPDVLVLCGDIIRVIKQLTLILPFCLRQDCFVSSSLTSCFSSPFTHFAIPLVLIFISCSLSFALQAPAVCCIQLCDWSGTFVVVPSILRYFSFLSKALFHYVFLSAALAFIFSCSVSTRGTVKCSLSWCR